MVRGFVIFFFLKTIDFVHYIYIIRKLTSECASDNLEQIVRVSSGLRHENLVKSGVAERLNVNKCNVGLSKSIQFNCFVQIDVAS